MDNAKHEPDEKPLLYILFAVYLDGVVIAVTEAPTAAEVVKTFTETFRGLDNILRPSLSESGEPYPRGITARPVGECPLEDLERLEKMFAFKTHLFNMSQMQMHLRAQKSGIAIAGAAPHGH